MAGLGGKNWTFEEEVTSSDVNGFLADQVVMRFADAATRTAGFGGAGEPTLAEGMVSYLDDTNTLAVYDGSAWVPYRKAEAGQVIQFSSVAIATSQVSSTTTYADITSASITITPKSASSKILVGYMTAGEKTSGNANNSLGIRLLRDSTVIATWVNCLFTGTALRLVGAVKCEYVDSPNTTSPITYKFQFANSQVAAVEVSVQQANSPGTMTVAEISG